MKKNEWINLIGAIVQTNYGEHTFPVAGQIVAVMFDGKVLVKIAPPPGVAAPRPFVECRPYNGPLDDNGLPMEGGLGTVWCWFVKDEQPETFELDEDIIDAHAPAPEVEDEPDLRSFAEIAAELEGDEPEETADPYLAEAVELLEGDAHLDTGTLMKKFGIVHERAVKLLEAARLNKTAKYVHSHPTLGDIEITSGSSSTTEVEVEAGSDD